MAILDTIRSNMQFRVNSLRSLITGTNDVSQAQPLKRRQAIIRKRREALREATSGITGSNDADIDVSAERDTSATQTTSSRNKDVSTAPASGSDVKKSATPSMSEVKKGTVKRANDRGYGS